MIIRWTHTRPTGFACRLSLGVLLLAGASHSHAASQIGGVNVKRAEPIVHAIQGKVHDRGTLFRPPTTIKPPPGPAMRDNRGDATKFVAPTCGHRPRPCKGMPRK